MSKPEPMITTKQLKLLTEQRYHCSPDAVENLTISQASDLIEACNKAKRQLTTEEWAAMIVKEETEANQLVVQQGVVEPIIDTVALNAVFTDLDDGKKAELDLLCRDLENATKSIQRAAVETGKVLANFKLALPFGKWLPFLEAIHFNRRTAERLMQVARDEQDLGKAKDAFYNKGYKLNTLGTKGKAVVGEFRKGRAEYFASLDKSSTTETDLSDGAVEMDEKTADRLLEEAANRVEEAANATTLSHLAENTPDTETPPETPAPVWTPETKEVLECALVDFIELRMQHLSPAEVSDVFTRACELAIERSIQREQKGAVCHN